MTSNCFTYGSLMCEDIMSSVCGLLLRGETAVLAEHSRHPVRGETYPGMIPTPGGSVTGVLYRGLENDVLARLDAFEGAWYSRERVTVREDSGDTVEAWTYLFRPEQRDRLLSGEWNFGRFLSEGKARFMAQYIGFDRA